jgi:hypothetical protein
MIRTALMFSFGRRGASVSAGVIRAVFTNRRALALALAGALGSRSSVAAAQRSSKASALTAMGTYALGTKQLPSTSADGCWLEVAPTQSDSVHVQVLCRKPAPGHHLGVFDARLPMHADTLRYERGDAADRCRITMRFVANHAVVAQEGTDITCGFGAFVNVSGSYVRLNARRPRFDLAPIERAPTSGPPRRRSGRPLAGYLTNAEADKEFIEL